MEWLLGLLGGLIGGNAAGAKNNLGVAGNSVAGALGGLLGGGGTGAILQSAMHDPNMVTQVVSQLAGGGVVGAIVTAIAGMVMKGRNSTGR